MSIDQVLHRIVREPSPDDLWQLHPYLLALDSPAAKPVLDIARSFYDYLSSIRSKLSSKQYSSLAAMLASSSVGVIALHDIIEAFMDDPKHALDELLTGGLSATFETLSAFQHVKAWETEFTSMHEEAAWQLYAALWQVSVETQPDLAIEKRQALLDELLSHVRDGDVDSSIRMVLIIRLFQVLLVMRLVPLVALMQPKSD